MNLLSCRKGPRVIAALLSLSLNACLAPDGAVPPPAAESAPSPRAASAPVAHAPDAHVLGSPPYYPSGVVTAPPAPPLSFAGPQGLSAFGDDTAGHCDSERLFAAAGSARQVIAELSASRPECFDDLFKGTRQSWPVLAPAVVQAVAEEARRRAENWRGGYDSGLASMAAFIKAGYLVSKERRRGAIEAYPAELDRAVIDASRAMLNNPYLWQNMETFKARDFNNWRMAAYFMVRDMALLLDSVRVNDAIRPLAQAFFERYARAPEVGAQSLARFAVHPVLMVAGNLADQSDFKTRLERGELDGLSLALNSLSRVDERHFEEGEVHRFAIREAGYYLRFERTRESALSAVLPVLQSHERLSPTWSHAAYTLKKANLDCHRYKFCRYEEELREKLFPQRWRFDHGDRVFESSLARNEAVPLYYAIKQVDAQFQRVTGATTPVAGDRNQKLTLVIYPSRQSYRDYQIILDELSVDNGGIYIESLGTLFTFQRDRADSWLTLEELVRHEYTHYLSGRYLRAGLFGTTALDDRLDRMPWFDEGLAEFMAGATRDHIAVRGNMVRGIAEDGPRRYRSPAQLMDFAYSDGWKHYLYSALWFNFLQQREPDALRGVLETVRRTDAAAFDRWVAEQGDRQAAPYAAFLGEQVGRWRGGELGEAGVRHGVDWLEAEAWQESDPDALARHFPAALRMRCRVGDDGSESELARFACEGLLPLSARTASAARDEAGAGIDRWLAGLPRQRNNFLAMNCAAGTAVAGGLALRCEGPLRGRDFAPRTPLPTSSLRLTSPSRCLVGQLSQGAQLLSQPALGRLRLDPDGTFFYYRDSGRLGQADRVRVRETRAGRWHEREIEIDVAAVDMPDEACWRMARR